MSKDGVPYIDTDNPSCQLQTVTIPGKGRFVKGMGRKDKVGAKLVISGTIRVASTDASVVDLGITSALAAAHDEEDEGSVLEGLLSEFTHRVAPTPPAHF